MRRAFAVCLLVGCVLAAPAGLRADEMSISHEAVGCVVAEKYAVLEARFDPVENVARARVYYRADGGPAWYFVEMKPQSGAFYGTLPKPKKGLKRINYYIDVLDKAAAGRVPLSAGRSD